MVMAFAVLAVGCQCQWRSCRTILGQAGERTLDGRTRSFDFKNSSVSLQTNRKRQLHITGAASFTDRQVAINVAEQQLVDGLLGIQGRGRSASPKQLKEVDQAIQALESEGGVPDPTSSSLIEGRWRLIFTTRPGTASPIQAAALIEDGRRILFRFDRAAFSFKFLPFKVPYPVPFRLLGDEAKGWLDTTYLSLSGNIRISRGNKGTTFVLQKNIEPRQKLFFAISSAKGVEEAIEELSVLYHNNDPANLDFLAGKWRLLWSSQPKNGNWLERTANSFQSLQIVTATGQLENLVEFIPGFRLRASGNFIAASNRQGEVNMEDAALELGSFKLPFKISSKIVLDFLYLDNKVRIMRVDDGWLSVHVREDGSG